jgi:outer membrane protein assembly factor BamB
LAVDAKYVYAGADVATELQSPGRLLRIDRQTNDIVELATSEGRVVEIAVDDEYVYWISLVGYLNGNANTDSAIYRISKQGGVKETLLDGLPHVYGLSRVGTRIWLAQSDGDQIIEMGADGSDQKVIATMVNSPNDIACDGENIYVTSWNKGGDLMHVENGMTTSMATTIGYGDQLLLGEKCIYWTEQYIDDDFNGVVRMMAR